MKRWKGNVTNSAYDAEGKFYLADEADAEMTEYSKVAAETAEKNGRLQAEIEEALDRIGDMLKQDDGQAYKEAQRFYDKHRKE